MIELLRHKQQGLIHHLIVPHFIIRYMQMEHHLNKIKARYAHNNYFLNTAPLTKRLQSALFTRFNFFYRSISEVSIL